MPPVVVELPDRVLRLTVIVATFWIAPPEEVAELRDSVLPLTVSVPTELPGESVPRGFALSRRRARNSPPPATAAA